MIELATFDYNLLIQNSFALAFMIISLSVPFALIINLLAVLVKMFINFFIGRDVKI